jgi:hypothetical protein
MKKLMLAILFAAIPMLALGGERIYLTDGRIFDGEVVKLDVKEVHFKYKKGATIESVLIFKASEVKRITRLEADGRETELNLMGNESPENPENDSRVNPGKATPPARNEENAGENASQIPPPAGGGEKAPAAKPNSSKSSGTAAEPLYKAELEKANQKAALAYVELAQWCEKNNASDLARENYKRALELDPECKPAGAGLGLVRYGGKWITPEAKTALEAREAEARKRADALTAAGYVNLAGIWITGELRKLIEDSPSNKRFSYLLVLQRYKDSSGLTAAEFLRFDNETKSVWHHLAPDEQKRVCPEMAGQKFEIPPPPKQQK